MHTDLTLADIKPLVPNSETVLGVYDKLKDVSNIFVRGYSTAILEHLLSHAANYWLIGEVGMVSVWPFATSQAHIHVTFWDKRLRGREQLARDFAGHIMKQQGIAVLWTAVPFERPATIAWAKRVGFLDWNVQDGKLVLFATSSMFHNETT